MIYDTPADEFVMYRGEREARKKEYKAILDLAKLSGDVKHVMRELAKNDLFFLLLYVLRVPAYVCDKDWWFARCMEFQKDPYGYLDIWPREHGKSTVITLAFAIQRILNDPDVTIGIFSYSRPIAKQFLRQIKSHFEQNDLLKELFPEILWDEPSKQAPKWSEDDGIIVKRGQIGLKEATVEAWGLVDGQPTSKHYKIIIYDDVVVPQSVSSPEMIMKTTDMLAMSFNLGSGENYKRIALGTRYHYADTYKEMTDRGAFNLRLYAATHNGKPDGIPWLLSREALAKKIADLGPYVAASQLFGNPVLEGEQVFLPGWIKEWIPMNFRGMNIYILVDPANEKKKRTDYTVFWVIGCAADGNYYIIDMYRDKMNLVERTNKLFELVRLYNPLKIGYEKYSIQGDIEHIKYVMQEQNFRFEGKIVELAGNMSKIDRIKRLVPLLSQGRMYFPKTLYKTTYDHKTIDVMQTFVNEEYLQFPFMKHDDMLDCLARIVETDLDVRFPKVVVVNPDDPLWLTKMREKERMKRRTTYEVDTYAYAGRGNATY